MPLTKDERQQLFNKVVSTAGLPVTAQDRLEACAIGMRQTLEVIADVVSLDDPVAEVIKPPQGENRAARGVQSEQPSGNGPSVN